jgi:LPS O-antigen subunit length determinant protein (WzzB/FepE family)
MFPVVLGSDLIVDTVARSMYTFRHDSRSYSMTLADYFGIANPDRLRHAVRGITTITTDQRTGEIYVRVETKYPELSQQVVAAYLSRLEDFNRNKRRSQARENEEYLARQLLAAEGELQEAEDNLETFQKSNLDWAMSGSPEILKELGRLKRTVEVKATTYAMLAREHEMAKLEAQKDIPIVRLLGPPSLPTMKSGPFRRNLIIISGIVAFMMIVFVLIVRHFVLQLTQGPEKDEYDNLRLDITAAFPRTNRIVNRLTTSIRERLPLIKS